MKITLQLSDKVYQQLVASGNRIQGSLGLVSPTEGNFNAHTRHVSVDDRDMMHKMAHGRIRISSRRTSVRLWFDHEQELIDVPVAIEREGREASGFAYQAEMINAI